MSENKYTKEDLKIMQEWSLDRKIRVTQTRILEWYQKWDNQVYVSFSGGKDSTCLADMTARICKMLEIPLTLVFIDTGLEYPEIRSFVREFKTWLEKQYEIEVCLEIRRPKLRFDEVIKQYGYPIISKDVSKKIHNARINPEGYTKDMFDGVESYAKSRFNISKYKYLIGSPFLISNKCCDVLKKSPLRQFNKETAKFPIIATMATESFWRKNAWLIHGCNAFTAREPTSKPMSFWTEQDVLWYLKRCEIPYCSIYGDIIEEWTNYKRKENKLTGKLLLTGEQRTGCVFCGFGCHLEKEPNRFQRLKISHPKLYDYCIRPVEEKGLGMGKVLDYIGVKY